MILADTSAWVEFDRRTGSGIDRRLTALLRDESPLAVTEPVVMEVLAGARDDRRFADLRRLLSLPALLRFDPVADFEGAARIYRTCRGQGVTPRGMVDCMIAAVALRHEAHLLTADRDLRSVAEVMEIPLDRARS